MDALTRGAPLPPLTVFCCARAQEVHSRRIFVVDSTGYRPGVDARRRNDLPCARMPAPARLTSASAQVCAHDGGRRRRWRPTPSRAPRRARRPPPAGQGPPQAPLSSARPRAQVVPLTELQRESTTNLLEPTTALALALSRMPCLAATIAVSRPLAFALRIGESSHAVLSLEPDAFTAAAIMPAIASAVAALASAVAALASAVAALASIPAALCVCSRCRAPPAARLSERRRAAGGAVCVSCPLHSFRYESSSARNGQCYVAHNALCAAHNVHITRLCAAHNAPLCGAHYVLCCKARYEYLLHYVLHNVPHNVLV